MSQVAPPPPPPPISLLPPPPFRHFRRQCSQIEFQCILFTISLYVSRSECIIIIIIPVVKFTCFVVKVLITLCHHALFSQTGQVLDHFQRALGVHCHGVRYRRDGARRKEPGHRPLHSRAQRVTGARGGIPPIQRHLQSVPER